MESERIPRSLLRGLASELQSMDIFLAWKIPCTLVQGASIFVALYSKRSVQLISHRFLAGPAALGTPEKRLPAGRTVIPFAFQAGPFNASFFISLFSHFGPPDWDSSVHYSPAGGKSKLLYQRTWPFLTLMTGIVPF
jgi:hypothetical protein